MTNSTDILNARILIVDDQDANVRLLEQILGRADYTCVASTMDPHAVCDLHRDNPYDLIVLDLQMPGMDGFQVMESLKTIETGSYLPVLVVTAQPDHRLRALEAGLASGGEEGPVHSAALIVYHEQTFPLVNLRVDWDDENPIRVLRKLWTDYKPQMGAYLQRAIDPTKAPSYGVPGDP